MTGVSVVATNVTAESFESHISKVENKNTNFPDWVVSIWEEEESFSAMNIITIGKVPQILRKVTSNDACFDPEVLSVGPYHHGKPHLKRLEKYKHIAMKSYTNSNYDMINAEPFYKALLGMVNGVRRCYEEKIEISDQDFTWIMIIDGCFVLEFITGMVSKKNNLCLSEHDKSLVVRDMMLLENQIPFLVLRILTLVKGTFGQGIRRLGAQPRWLEDPFDAPTETKYADRSVDPVPVGDELLTIINQFTDRLTQIQRLSSAKKGEKKSSVQGGDVNEDAGKTTGSEGDGKDIEPVHLLDSFRSKLLGKKSTQKVEDTESTGRSWYSFRSATELKAAGIKFRRSETTKLSDVKFKSHYFFGELFLPPIVVDDSTKHKFLNTIAYELCPDGPRNYGISSYICLMDSLIDREEDVKELRSEGIVLNSLGSDEDVAQLFNVLATDLTLDSQAYVEVKRGIESHCKGRWNIYMANLYYTHFNTPWTVIATIAAIFLLILSVVQTYFAIYPSSN
ncbi:UPF0481 protein At3g47200-like [Tasmannia lanceolata]|uniref:UPF0481 protein At3g47200-like n=1 Tax=Tasmannia lanceolata TaxID=3420 RepID=UPI004063944E